MNLRASRFWTAGKVPFGIVIVAVNVFVAASYFWSLIVWALMGARVMTV